MVMGKVEEIDDYEEIQKEQTSKVEEMGNEENEEKVEPKVEPEVKENVEEKDGE